MYEIGEVLIHFDQKNQGSVGLKADALPEEYEFSIVKFLASFVWKSLNGILKKTHGRFENCSVLVRFLTRKKIFDMLETYFFSPIQNLYFRFSQSFINSIVVRFPIKNCLDFSSIRYKSFSNHYFCLLV